MSVPPRLCLSNLGSNLCWHSLGSPPVLSLYTLWHVLLSRREFRGEIEPTGAPLLGIQTTCKNWSRTDNDRAALCQSHDMETRSKAHVVMLYSPHSPRSWGHCSWCTEVQLHLHLCSYQRSLGVWNNLLVYRRTWGSTRPGFFLLWPELMPGEEATVLHLHPCTTIGYFFSLSFYLFFFIPCPATCKTSKTFFIYQEN